MDRNYRNPIAIRVAKKKYKKWGEEMFSNTVSEVATILVQALMITIAGWIFVFAWRDIGGVENFKLLFRKEIVGMFKRADVNQNRIKLIQELTLLDKSRIINILKGNGCEILPSEMNKTIRKELMQEVFIEMYYDGKSDFAIALKLGVSKLQ